MKTHEQILSMMTKSHAQAPMQFNALLDISGLQPATLNMVLDQMYDARKINQAKVTRAGIEQREVWPVAIVNKANPYRSGVATAPVIPPPRRNEAPAIKPVQLIKTEEVTMNTNQSKETPRALTILKYIEANPNCNSAQISHATGIDAPRSYIKAHITRGAVLVSGDNRKDMKMQLAAGRTAQDIYGNGYTKRQPAPSAALLAEVQAGHADVYLPVGRVGFQPHAEPCSVGIELPTLPPLELADAEPAPTYEIPAFLRKSEKQQPVDDLKQDLRTGFAKPTLTIGFETEEDCIELLFEFLPPESSIIISRRGDELSVDIEAEVFGRKIAKTLRLDEVRETLNALHIVTVEMA